MMNQKPIGIYAAETRIADPEYDPKTGRRIGVTFRDDPHAAPFAAYDKEGRAWRVSADEAATIAAEIEAAKARRAAK